MDTIIYSCIAVDDEEPALDKIKQFVSKIPFLELKSTFNNGLDAMTYLKSHKTDILFLDIQMDELSGLQLIDLLDNKPLIILTTAYEQYALKGYELNVTDYLLKPYAFERFMKAVNKACKIIDEHRHTPQPVSDKNIENNSAYIFIKTEYRIQKIFLTDIMYIEGQKDYLKIVTANDSFMTLLNFNTMLEMLPASNFMRVHKSYIVALDKIESIERERIIIQKERIPIGDTYRASFFAQVQARSGLNINKSRN